jgi:ribosomal protein S18 acetylase RimI-like enzyme
MVVISDYRIALAEPADGELIACMSRELIESGLGWKWTPARVGRSLRDPATNVAVARLHGELAGFGIMRYRDEEAHLVLLAVQARHRRRGVGAALVGWLEASALTAGIGVIRLEARCNNAGALAFYQRLGYRLVSVVREMYDGREDGVRLARDLWA